MGEGPHPEIRETPGAIRERQPITVGEASTAGSIWAEVWERPWLGFALTATVPGVIFALLGPFGSFGAPLWLRFAYWVPTMALGAVFGALITRGLEWSKAFKTRPIAQVVVLALSITAVMAGVAWAMGQLVFGAGAITFGPIFVFYVLVLSILTSGLSAIIRARSTRIAIAAAPVSPSAPHVPASLSARLPAKLKDGEILALQSEDHYVRVHTDKGSDLILMRLADAIALMGETPGARSHRSWWVAKGAVKEVRRENGRVWLKLANAIEAPVSRNYASELRKAGWLDRSRPPSAAARDRGTQPVIRLVSRDFKRAKRTRAAIPIPSAAPAATRT